MDVHAAFFGRTTLDVLYSLDALPPEDSKVFARDFRAAPGGPACNAAITFALLGGRATLVTPLGKGSWAAIVRDHLARHQINLVDLAGSTAYETPLTTVLAASVHGTRTIINPPLSLLALETPAPEWNADWAPSPSVVLTDGFHLNESLPMLRACRAIGAALVLDGGSWKPGTEELAPLLTAAICSERFTVPGLTASPETTLRWFAAQGVPSAAVTRGPAPIFALHQGLRFTIEIPPTTAIDTLGAGDVLHGAFCYHYAVAGDFEQSLRTAASIATESCRSLGIEGLKRARS